MSRIAGGREPRRVRERREAHAAARAARRAAPT